MIKFKTILFFILLSVFTKVLFAANGKQIKHDVIDEEIAVFVDRKIVDLNLQAAFDKLIRSLALSRACNRTGGPVNITFTGIQYNMIQHKYSYNVSGYIRTLLQRQSIPNVVFLNRASALIKWTMEQNRLKRNGTISGQPRKFESADYILSGYLYGLSRKSNMYYRFSLRLTDISRGGIVWEDDYEVSLPVYQISSCEISHDGSYVAVAGEDSQLTIWDLYSGTIDFSTGCNVRCVSFLPDSSILALGTDKGSLLLYNIESNEELWKFEKLFSLTVFSPNINFSRCGKYILANGVILNASSGFPLGIDTNYNTLWRKKLTKGIICSLNGEQLILTQEGYYKGSKNKSDFVCYLDKSLLTNIDWSSEYIHNLKAEGEANGTVVLRRKDTDKEIARLMHFTDGEWLIITPEGYYNSSEKGDMYINVRIGGGVYGVDNFREKFYRPDLVRLALAGRSLKRFRSIETVNQSPIISFVDTPSGVNINEVTVTVKLQDIGGGIGNVRFYINGCAVLQDKNTAEGVAGKSVTKKYKLKLVNGENKIRAIVFNSDNTMHSADAIQKITACYESISKPSLYAFVVGINDYKNPVLQLSNAVADAKLFSESLKKGAEKLFENVNIRMLTNRHATSKNNLIAELKAMRDMRPDDLFVFFIAGHGTVEDGEYFLLTSDVGLTSAKKLKEKSISQDTLKELIVNIPTTKKLIVLDTCNAQAMGDQIIVAIAMRSRTRGMDDDAAMKKLRNAVGSTVLAACSTTQEALEGYRGHGLFTYVVSEGLRGAADMDGDGFVKTTELANYIGDEVTEIAEKEFDRVQYANPLPYGMAFPVTKVRKD